MEEDRARFMELWTNHSHAKACDWTDSKVREATEIWELFLVHGVKPEVAGAKIVELYSRPRVTKQLSKFRYKGLEIGSTFDIRPDADGNSFDLTKARHRAIVRHVLRTEQPYFVIGSPPCKEYCLLQQNWNHHRMAPEDVRRRLVEAKLHLDFCTEIY